jgi:hypothetical protein
VAVVHDDDNPLGPAKIPEDGPEVPGPSSPPAPLSGTARAAIIAVASKYPNLDALSIRETLKVQHGLDVRLSTVKSVLRQLQSPPRPDTAGRPKR